MRRDDTSDIEADLPGMLAGIKPPDCSRIAEELNQFCECVTLDRAALDRELCEGAELQSAVRLTAEHARLFSGSAVFVSQQDIEHMAAVVAAVERVVALAPYREHVLAYAPAIARHEPCARGVFLGYDFHLGAPVAAGQGGGPQLIEINTNAGGGLLNALLGRAQLACCAPVAAMLPGAAGKQSPEELFLEMFRREWQLARGKFALSAIAIVDSDPKAQYLYPEFVLFQQMFARAGLYATICDPAELEFDGGRLMHGGQTIDLVYNRLTDFSLELDNAAALRAAYLADRVVLTPHPRAHALYADKRNLAVLTDDGLLRHFGVDAPTRELLVSGVPRVARVTAGNAEAMWAGRKQLFFKPAGGFGSRGAYRGDKLTRGVFAQIVAGDYIAQRLVPPSSRRVAVDGQAVDLKLDLRNYVYDNQVQLLAARLYRGQTTNFRTSGGGFAPVLTVPCGHLGGRPA